MVFLLVSIALGCGGESAPSEPRAEEVTPPPRASAASEAAALQRANAAADALATTLRARLLAAMGEGGPPAAMRVCADAAQGMAADVTREHRARVGRSSLRLRNPANAAPPWVGEWLRTQGERPAAGVEGFARIEDGHARVLRPIAVEGPCVTCHGSPAMIAPEIATLLRAHYPNDRAIGYAVGDLRGALWAEIAVD